MSDRNDPPKSSKFNPLHLVLLGVAIALGVTIYQNAIHPDIFPKRFHTVVPGEIYRSGKLTPGALDKVVREHEIRTIVDLGAWVGDEPERVRARERHARTAEALGVDLHTFELIGDATGDPQQYVEALRIATDPANQPVLVHCGAGTERTGCLVALYRMEFDEMTLDEAYAEAESIGHSGDRNPHLREVLERDGPLILEAFNTGRSFDAVRDESNR